MDAFAIFMIAIVLTEKLTNHFYIKLKMCFQNTQPDHDFRQSEKPWNHTTALCSSLSEQCFFHLTDFSLAKFTFSIKYVLF